MPVSQVAISDTVDIGLGYIIEMTYFVTAKNFFKIAEQVVPSREARRLPRAELVMFEAHLASRRLAIEYFP